MILRKILIFLFISQFLYAGETYTQFVLKSYNDCKTEIDAIGFFANIEKNCKLSEKLYKNKNRNTLVYNDKSYVNNAYPVNLPGSAGYIQFANLVNKQDEIKNLYDLLIGYSSINTTMPEFIIQPFCQYKDKVLFKLSKLPINTEDIKKRINKIGNDLKKKETEKLQTMQNELKDFKSNTLKRHCEIQVLDFIKTLFEYLRFFAPEAIPNINEVSNLKELPQDEIYGEVFSEISNIDKVDIKKIFTSYKAIINKYLHTEYMLYYDLIKSNQLITWPIYFGSYKEMCSDCQALWAKYAPFQQGQYNVICFFKKEDEDRKEFIKDQINQSCLQFYK